MSQVIKIDQERCIGCGMCVKDCPCHAIRLKDQCAEMFMENCMECGHCLAVCPKAAVSMHGYDMDEVLQYDPEHFTIQPEQFLNSVKCRRSVRRFKKRPVEREKIEQIIEAGRYTPTGTNRQKTRYVVVENPQESIEKDAVRLFRQIKRAADGIGRFVKLPLDTKNYKIHKDFFFHGAPAVILVISEDDVDGALAAANMGTMAEAQGLGLFYVGFFALAAKLSKKIKRKLKLSKKEKVVTAIALGYPNVKYFRTVPRKKANIEWM